MWLCNQCNLCNHYLEYSCKVCQNHKLKNASQRNLHALLYHWRGFKYEKNIPSNTGILPPPYTKEIKLIRSQIILTAIPLPQPSELFPMCIMSMPSIPCISCPPMSPPPPMWLLWSMVTPIPLPCMLWLCMLWSWVIPVMFMSIIIDTVVCKQYKHINT